MAQTGIVKWYNDAKGFGFITPDSRREDVFVSAQGVTPGSYSLREGAKVSFDLVVGPKGPTAKNVTVL